MKIYTVGNINEIPKGMAVSVGMFDGVHRGHRKVLESLQTFANKLGTEPLVITFDRHPRYVLRNDDSFHLLNTNEERYRIIEQCGIRNVLEIHFTPEVARLSACEFARKYLVQQLEIKGLLLGYDNMFGNKSNNDFDLIPTLAKECGFAIAHEGSILLNDLKISSTQIRKALAAGDIALANRMLGYRYQITGTVVHGREVGRTLHFPTANVEIADHHKMIPADGVYCVDTEVDGLSHKAMCNIGTQPTFGSDKRAVEVHLFDFDGDIYGKTVTLTFVGKIRDTQKFGSSQELVAQLNNDKAECLSLFQNHKNEGLCEDF
ncbi:MAG: riboflavin biosynthesis protein RibF [Bacteroidales bacterium]|nr:riboflavin biosynthesis protein RibF [Bacteroidales bacterium]MBR5028252.1 riboflavin biosynthesis protein RibF [Bacteroidales bacterium]